MKLYIKENDNTKDIRSQGYNYHFNKETGLFMRWGKTKEDDPEFSWCGPEIADIEISTICHGINGKPCKFCYKSNTGVGENMSLETFKTIFHKLPKTLTQIAFGIGDIDSNPDLFKIMEYCRINDYNYVVPNVTINGWNLTDSYANKLKELCGAVAVSRYKQDVNVCYDAVKKLTDLGMKQVNIHMLVAEETYEDCLQLINDVKEDSRLKNLNAIVFLSMKPKGKRNTFNCLKDSAKYKKIIDYAFEKGVNIGFDSCSAPKFLEAVKDSKNYKQFETMAEPCESMLFSIYINTKGQVTPCSFMEDESEPIDMIKVKDFLKEVWYNKITTEFRKKLVNNVDCRNCRKCPTFDIY